MCTCDGKTGIICPTHAKLKAVLEKFGVNNIKIITPKRVPDIWPAKLENYWAFKGLTVMIESADGKQNPSGHLN